MKKSLIRILSMMLCILCLVSLLPMTAMAADTTLGVPKNLKWNKEYDYETGELRTCYGVISWQATKPLAPEISWYEIKAYKDGDLQLTHRVGYDTNFIADGTYMSFDLRPLLSWGSGKYHFTIRAYAEQDGYAHSKTVKSTTWSYTRPSAKMDKPTNLQWNWPEMTWDTVDDPEAKYMIRALYSPTKPDPGDEMWFFHTQWLIKEGRNTPPYGDMGPGYYAFEVRTITSNLKSYRNSDWVQVGELYHYPMETPQLDGYTITSTGSPKLTWNAVEHAEEYQVYRATSLNGTYKRIKTTSKTSFVNSVATVGNNYYYKVRAVTENGAKSSFSNVIKLAAKLDQPEAKATNLSSTGNIKVSWDKVSGAEKYAVYRATSEDGPFTRIKTTSSTSFINSTGEVGQKYYYQVQALHEKEAGNSAFSDTVSRFRKLPRTEVTVKNNSSTGYIELSWDEVEGAAGYNVYRATSKDGTYKRQITLTDTSYTDINASDNRGKLYYYKVKAIPDMVSDENDGNSAYSSAVSRRTKLARPNVQISLTSKGNPKLTWDPVDGAVEYKVYRATSKSGTYKLMKTTEKTSYINSSVTEGKTYYYKVKAIHSNSNANSSYSYIDKIKAE